MYKITLNVRNFQDSISNKKHQVLKAQVKRSSNILSTKTVFENRTFDMILYEKLLKSKYESFYLT